MDEKRDRGPITEQRISTLLQRYSDKTVLQLLQEVAVSATEKIDWNALVKNTKTGISSAREYQTLWRHLAYGHALTDEFDDANPLDDDSDLEYELEADPDVSLESSMEASACVKALIASACPIDTHVPNNLTVEAPLTINIPMLKEPSDSSLPTNAMQGKNIVIPVSVQKEPLSPGTSDEKMPSTKSGADVPPRRKRKVWSSEDDLKLTAAVQEHGEQNWANIADGDFKNERTPVQLSKRWASIRKKKDNLNTGINAQLSEARRAANKAIQLVLGPKGNNMKAAHQMSNIGTETSQHESQIASAPPSNPQLGASSLTRSSTTTKAQAFSSIPSKVVKTAEVSGVSSPASGMKELVQRNQVSGLDNISPEAAVDLISATQLTSVGNQSKPEVDKRTSASGNTPGGNTHGDQVLQVASPCPEVEDNGEKHGDTITTVGEIHDKHDNFSCESPNGNGEASTVNTAATARDKANA